MPNRNRNLYCVVVQLILIFNVALAIESDYDESDFDYRADFYDKCAGGQDGMRCTGIPTNCVSSRNCEYGVGYWEDETHFWSTMIGPDRGNSYAVALGFTPFEKSGNNLTAACKPKVTLEDVRVIFYKMEPQDMGGNENDRPIWTSGTQGFGKDGTAWEHNCQYKSRYANGLAKLNEDERRHVILNGEFVYLEYAVYPDRLNPLHGELSQLFDSKQYSSVDGVVFKNF